MPDRLVDQFLERGLLDLKGNDEWYKHITATATAVSSHLFANPNDIIPFSYAALHPSVDGRDRAIQRTRSLLKEEWKTYASVSMASPIAMFRAIILDALLTNSATDMRTRTTLALLLTSALPHLPLGPEADVWKDALAQLLHDVERHAERAWSVPSALALPAFPRVEFPSVTVSLKAKQVNKKTLEQGMLASAGPNNQQGHATQGNQYWPSQGDPWSYEFAPLAADAISKAITQATSTRTATANTDKLADAMISSLTTHLESFLDQVASTVRGLELRSRLLWWKEALVSPSAQVGYRDVDPTVAPGLMAYDYQTGLPSIAPFSVSAFLRETIRVLLPDQPPATVLDWIRALAADSHAAALRQSLDTTLFAGGFAPLVTLARLDNPNATDIERRTIFSSTLSLTAAEFGLLVFHELQSIKAATGRDPLSFEGAPDPELDMDEDNAA